MFIAVPSSLPAAGIAERAPASAHVRRLLARAVPWTGAGPAPGADHAGSRKAAAVQGDAPKKKHLFGDWGGLRGTMHDAGVDVDASYTGEAAADVHGGKRHGAAYAGQAAVKIDLDGQRMLGWHGFSAHIAVVNRHGRNASAHYVGDSLFHAQEIYGAGGGVAAHLVYAFVEQKFAGGGLDVKAGRLPVMNDFGTLPDGCKFLSLTTCANRGLVANLGWTSWPRATWGVSITGSLTDTLSLGTGVYEVNPHTGGDWGLRWSLEGSSGVMVPLELAWKPRLGDAGLPGTWRLGVYRDTAEFPEWDTAINGAPLYRAQAPAARDARYGAYGLVQQMLWREPGTDDQGLTLLAGYDTNSHHTSLFHRFAFVGLLDKGLLEGRPDDRLGVQVSYGRVSPDLTRRQRGELARGEPLANDAPGVQTGEWLVEAEYAIAVGRGVELVPDVQWVHHPRAADTYPDAAVVGLRIKASL